ncbi:hypothetical protein HUW46_09085 [Amycolatopsis sp. CA-230715]|nr:hypothetical protein HUW46_09085 [Amycolatopsis sp. CA-230715]
MNMTQHQLERTEPADVLRTVADHIEDGIL